MNAGVLVPSQTKMMLTYPQPPTVFRPTFGIVSQGPAVGQFPNFPVAFAPTTILQTQIPAGHSQIPPKVIGTTASPRSSVPTMSSSSHSASAMSPKVQQKTHSSFSIDSILGKRETKEPLNEPASVKQLPVSPISTIPSPPSRTSTASNGLVYFYTPATASAAQSRPPFPFATAPRPFDHDLQRSPLGVGPMVLASGNLIMRHILNCIHCMCQHFKA